MKKVLYLTNYPAPYRVTFFSQLGKLCDLTVLFTADVDEQKHRNKAWFNLDYSGFNAVFLKKAINIKKKRLCLDVIGYLKQPWDFIISGGYADPTLMLAFEWLKRHHKPFYLEMDGGLIKNDNWIRYHIKKHYISMPSGWLSSGKATDDYFIHYGADKNKIFFYPFSSMTDADILRARQILVQDKSLLRKELNMKEKNIVITVGRFSYQNGYGKGYDTLLDVAERFGNETGFYIIGDEPTSEFIEMKAKRNLANVHYVGFKQKDELQYYYAAADVFVLLTRDDVWGLVINEAMSYGLPVITTDKCGAGLNLIEEGSNGYIVPVNNAEVTYERLHTLLSSSELMDSFSKESLRSISHYTIENMTSAHIDLLGGVRRIIREFARRRLKMTNQRIILTVGQIIPRKGIDILLEACKTIGEDVACYIVGGEPTEEMTSFIKQNNLYNVHFIDFVPKNKIGDYYRAANIFVIPTREDIWGLVVNEAVAYGLPIVGTDKCVAALELVDKGNGIIVPANDSAAISKAVQNLFDNNLDAMTAKSYSVSVRYSIEKMVEAHMDLFNS